MSTKIPPEFYNRWALGQKHCLVFINKGLTFLNITPSVKQEELMDLIDLV